MFRRMTLSHTKTIKEMLQGRGFEKVAPYLHVLVVRPVLYT